MSGRMPGAGAGAGAGALAALAAVCGCGAPPPPPITGAAQAAPYTAAAGGRPPGLRLEFAPRTAADPLRTAVLDGNEHYLRAVNRAASGGGTAQAARWSDGDGRAWAAAAAARFAHGPGGRPVSPAGTGRYYRREVHLDGPTRAAVAVCFDETGEYTRGRSGGAPHPGVTGAAGLHRYVFHAVRARSGRWLTDRVDAVDGAAAVAPCAE